MTQLACSPLLPTALLALACGSGGADKGCPAIQIECGGLCVDPVNNNQHCGRCDNACDTGQICGDGTCAVACPEDKQECDGICFDLESTDQHCGDCRTRCDPTDQQCRAGRCELACDQFLNSAVSDPWGIQWDGLERAGASFAVAQSECTAIGGRLPTATELYRVSANQSAAVGQSTHTNFIWSIVPHTGSATLLNRVTVRLSDGATSGAPDDTESFYRCVCPGPQPISFGGNNCNGPPGGGCFPLSTGNGRYQIDVEDRPALPKGSAVWECTFNHGHLASLTTLVEAVDQGIPNGTNTWLYSADDSGQARSTLFKWSGNGAGWMLPENLNSDARHVAYGFRCTGVDYVTPPNPNTIGGSFVGPRSRYTADSADTAQEIWIDIHDGCWDRGGHVPTTAELVELIQQGLPGSSAAHLWTSDQNGHHPDPDDFLVGVVRWTDTQLRFPYLFADGAANEVSWAVKNPNLGPDLGAVPRGTRCIYYPIDDEYTGPDESDCSGGCMALPLPGNVMTPKLWLDQANRGPADFEGALRGCRAAGGHLASERDMLEAIRQGLPNDPIGEWLYTSELGSEGTTPLPTIVAWTNTAPDFGDQYPAEMTWSFLTTERPYRCMWTNEIR